MSYAIHAFAIPTDLFTRIIGSGDQDLVDEIAEEFRQMFDEVDGFDSEVSSVEQALGDLVHGRPFDQDAGFKYGYALEALCWTVGDFLPNGAWSGMRSEWFEAVDEAVAGLGIDFETFSVSSLIHGGLPLSLPEIYDFPEIGFTTEAQARKALSALENASVSGLTDDDIVESIEQVIGWLDLCVRRHRDLLCTYS